MRISGAFPSKYLRAADIPDGKFIPVTIDHVTVENVAGNDDPDAEKPVIYFANKSKGMVLNKTNSSTISAAYGDETDDWRGKQILLYAAETTYQGKTMPCLRVKVQRGSAAAAPAPRQPQPVAASPVSEEQQFEEQQFNEDDIPF